MAEQPYEIVAAPFEIYIAPIGESMPAVTLEPPVGNWVLIGTSGDSSYGEEGVTIEHSETIEDHRGLGGTGIIKSFRTEEGILVSLMLHDLTLEEVSYALNMNAVQTSSNDKLMDSYKGQQVATRALLVRGNGAGAYGADYNLQWEFPRVRVATAHSLNFQKGIPAGIALAFEVMEDLSAASDADRFGIVRQQFQN